ncbi:MAG: hypothetical protein P9L88_05020 [Candidatus Tantalella remota]|nr:hypothetical protein [Candidatus Tantalella remota]
MKKLISILVCILMIGGYVHAQPDFYRQWYDHWYSEGYEEGKKDEKFDPDGKYEPFHKEQIEPAYQEFKAIEQPKKAKDYLRASREGFYAGYRAGYYREQAGEIVNVMKEKYDESRISDFKFGKMDESAEVVVAEEIRILVVPAGEQEKKYFGFTFEYSDDLPSTILTIVLTLPGNPGKDLGPNFHSETNSLIVQHSLDPKGGKFGSKWNFSRGDLTGDFRLALYLGGRLVQSVWFKAYEEGSPIPSSGDLVDAPEFFKKSDQEAAK